MTTDAPRTPLAEVWMATAVQAIEQTGPLDDAAALFDGSADVVRRGWTELAQAMAAPDVRDRA